MFTVTKTADVNTSAQLDFDTFALYHADAVRFEALKVVAFALAISEKPVVAEVVDLCHWIVPSLPAKVNKLEAPEQTVEAATETVPATGKELKIKLGLVY